MKVHGDPAGHAAAFLRNGFVEVRAMFQLAVFFCAVGIALVAVTQPVLVAVGLVVRPVRRALGL